jgi:hypothetical protein
MMHSPISLRLAGALAIAAFSGSSPLAAQSLHGSRSSISRMHNHAVNEGLRFYRTASSVRAGVRNGDLVRLRPNGTYRLHRVTYPYVQPQTRTFVERLASQFRTACGEELVVTSAVRPKSRQPWNSTRQSVHPTGMAIDFRKPSDSDCRNWLRQTLLELEDSGIIEATEEFNVPHFHVAVFPTQYARYVAGRQGDEDQGR